MGKKYLYNGQSVNHHSYHLFLCATVCLAAGIAVLITLVDWFLASLILLGYYVLLYIYIYIYLWNPY